MSAVVDVLSGRQVRDPFLSQPLSYAAYYSGVTAIAYLALQFLPYKICTLNYRYALIYGAVSGLFDLSILAVTRACLLPLAGGQHSSETKTVLLVCLTVTSFLASSIVSLVVYGKVSLWTGLWTGMVKEVRLIDHLSLYSVSFVLSEMLRMRRG